MAEPFERDFGYLMPFFDKVEQAAADLADPGAREELVRLMREERERWARIRALLGGASGQGGGRAPAAAPPAPRAAAPVRPGPAPRTALTVGSLRVRRNDRSS